MKNKKGMSLIVLVITILVMIILAGVVIVSLSDNNPIKKANEATEKANFAEYANELELYHTNHTALTHGYNKKELNVSDPNEMKKYINSITKEDAKKYVIVQGVLYDKEDAKIGNPKLLKGMTPVKWDGTKEVNTKADDPDWYEYVEGTGTTDNNSTRLANAKTADGSYFVWIPRFEYKITYKNPSKISEGAEIDVNIIRVDQTTPTEGYKIHPAFTNGTANKFANGEWDKELAGIWVAKYEMSNNSGKLASKPHEISLRDIKAGDMYTKAYNYDRAKESHMIKNSEWGAVAYFTHSKYGRNQNAVEQNRNTKFKTGNDNIVDSVKQSSTGNITGIYDLSGGGWEYVAGYITNGHDNLKTYGESFTTKTESTKYATVYPIGTPDLRHKNYQALKDVSDKRYGDALVETSSSGELINASFFQANSYYTWDASPFFIRGAHNNSPNAGTFAFYYHDGNVHMNITSRIVLCGF